MKISLISVAAGLLAVLAVRAAMALISNDTAMPAPQTTVQITAAAQNAVETVSARPLQNSTAPSTGTAATMMSMPSLQMTGVVPPVTDESSVGGIATKSSH